MRIADEELTVDQAFKRVETYATDHFRTLEVFDGLGTRGYKDTDPNSITLADIGRLLIINGQPVANDVGALLDADTSGLEDLPIDATLDACEVADQVWTTAGAVYDAFRLHNIGPAKRSKLLHAKRPGLFFIHDSKTGERYEKALRMRPEPVEGAGLGYWAAARDDIMQGEFDHLMARVARHEVGSSGRKISLARLSRLRVLDIVCWSPSA